jgi:hypothetical protein
MNRLLKIALSLTFAVMLATTPTHAQNSNWYVAPEGRLTLQSLTSPVMTQDVVNATKIYYAPYIGSFTYINGVVENYNNLTLNLNSSSQPSGNIYDVFLITQTLGSTTSMYICAGSLAWQSSTQRASGGGIVQSNGIWVNTTALTSCLNGTTSYSVPANGGLYLGSFYTTGNGETGVNLKPSAAAGGTDNVIGIWNAYNRVPISSLVSDNNTSWTDSSTSWQTLDHPGAGSGTYNRVTYLDGLGESDVEGRVTTIAYNATLGNGSFIGIAQDSTTNSPIVFASNQSAAAGSAVGAASFAATENFPPNMGLHYLQAMEWSPNGTASTFAFNGSSTFLLYRGEY